MADLPAPVGITASVSRPFVTATSASSWPGRSRLKSNASNAARRTRRRCPPCVQLITPHAYPHR
jgi:hypothetical protein